jgi:antitoxin HicB
MKDLKYYLELPYTIVVRRDEDGDFVARVDELPGCAAHGKSPEEALANLEEAKQLWISESLEAGQNVPEPAAEEALPSGKWVQRVPRSLHRKLTLLARRERVSLNQLVTAVLSEAVGAEPPGGKRRAPKGRPITAQANGLGRQRAKF